MIYRPEIDGLRAVAVLLVLFFHAGLNFFPGGYIGVDVFFVLSGFLITSILLKDFDDGRFSIAHFYERRVRRILPALSLVLIVATGLAFYFFMPSELVLYGRSLLATTAFVSNILFYREAGYFDASAHIKPLLHTWSLGVEEQFYIFFPLYLWFLIRFFPRALLALTVVGALLSLGLSEILVLIDKQLAAFYNLPTRAWELGAGSILAISIQMRKGASKSLTANIFSFAGLLFILYGALFPAPPISFPGISALPAVLGTVLVLYGTANASIPNHFRVMLSVSPLVFIGKISYSLYLWHWVLLVFAWYIGENVFWPTNSLCLIISFLLAALSWKYVEQPFRKNSLGFSRQTLFVGFAAVSIILFIIGAVFTFTKGVPSRFSQDIIRIADVEKGIPKFGTQDGDPDGYAFGVKDATFRPSLAVFGDSHANALSPAFDTLSLEEVGTGRLYKMAGCFPSAFEEVLSRPDCKAFTEKVFHTLENTPSIQTVALVARWSAYPRWWAPVEADGRQYANDKTLSLFENALEDTVSRLQKAGKSIVIVAEAPSSSKEQLVSLMARYKARGRSLTPLMPLRKDINEKQAPTLRRIRSVAQKYEVKIFYLSDALCDETRCEILKDGRSLYYDDNHLSAFGAKSLSPKLKESGIQF